MAGDNDQTVDNKVSDDNVNVDDNVNTEENNTEENNDVIEDEDAIKEQKKKGILDKIKSIIKRTPDGGGDTDDNDTGSDSSDGGDNKVTDDDIPDEFVDAALAANWTKQQIIDHAKKYSNDELMSQMSFLQKQDSDSEDGSENSDDKDKSSGESKDKSGESDEKADNIKDEVIKELTERIAKLEENEQKKNDDDSTRDLITKAQRATSLMDELDEKYDGVFGKYEELPRFPDGTVIPNSPQNIARNQVWNLARTLNDAGIDFETAMSTSLNAYKGEHLEKSVKRSTVQQLKRSAKKVSPKRSSTTATSKAKSGPEVVREVLKKHGRV